MEIEKITEVLKPYLTEYRTTDLIMRCLKENGIEINKRDFQEYVMLYNKQFDHQRTYLASNSQGYCYTDDKELIKQSCNQRLAKFLSGIKNIKETYRIIGDKNQLSLLDSIENDTQALVDGIEIAEQTQQTNLFGWRD